MKPHHQSMAKSGFIALSDIKAVTQLMKALPTYCPHFNCP
jgi:hypothetical protein